MDGKDTGTEWGVEHEAAHVRRQEALIPLPPLYTRSEVCWAAVERAGMIGRGEGGEEGVNEPSGGNLQPWLTTKGCYSGCCRCV